MSDSLLALAKQHGVPLFDLSALELDTLPLEFINHKLVETHRCLPISYRHNRLFLATSDPCQFGAFTEFEFNTGLKTSIVLVDANQLQQVIDKLLGDELDQLELGDLDEQSLSQIEVQEQQTIPEPDSSGDDAPIVIYINKLLTDAIKKGASDLHFEPFEQEYRVRFRIDGILHQISTPPVALAGRISARLKVMSKLDIAERRLPQDGRIKLKIGPKRAIDFRISTLPTLFGEKIVMRILDGSSTMLNISGLGYEDAQQQQYLDTLNKPQGMILVTGPTGSGKTVSLYTGLNILNTESRNISTAEDPVEINLPGINQVQINPKAGLNFSTALRAFLRQDPDVVMVGEIRDLETAEIAIKAAQTGHLVLSTLHTNSATETLTRLLNMGVASYNIASSVSLIIAQRLCRKLCHHCKRPHVLPAQVLMDAGFDAATANSLPELYLPQGCKHCTDGYQGRIGLYELLPMSAPLEQAILKGATGNELTTLALSEGMQTLRRSGLNKVLKGITSLEEVNRVTSR
ncbi:type IV-A pilus assembly ATPase PilB [Ferrimonas aestuarii]|uniref:Type IV-A pilus assembly ATPase PilB n=1 Tax=Ferrimonas aestuarii TaxID=2569539 RepID=A0A4U1BNL6_9GAMM|nr:type IV-A pilus assembly ATPase PilB [Ferrimonas aestuarii]TKB53711.1 type IV-A pilus assembly ATPase PilB [Ferrimonas aestuarii]